jgi:hypothetical protein
VICIVNVSAAVDKHRRTISDEIGTGTACTFKGHKLILTAEHVHQPSSDQQQRREADIGIMRAVSCYRASG